MNDHTLRKNSGFNKNNSYSIYFIAENEFRRVVGNPLIIVISAILLMIAALNGIGFAHLLPGVEHTIQGKDAFFLFGLQQIFSNFSLYSVIFAVFIGVISIGEERSKKSLSILLSKPLYRRDVVIGKFFGVGAFLIFFITFNFIVSSLLVIIFFREPLSMQEFVLRLTTIIFLLFLECMLSLGITMFIGIVFKNLLTAIIMAMTFLYIDWYSNIIQYAGSLAVFSPSNLFFTIIASKASIFDTSVGYTSWLNTVLPFIILMVSEVIVIILINCYVFTRSDEY